MRKLTVEDFLHFSETVGEDFCDQVEYIGKPYEFSEKLKEKYPHLVDKIEELDRENQSADNLANVQTYQELYDDFDDEVYTQFYKDYCDLCVNLSEERIKAVWEEFENFEVKPLNI